jgi:hypothetical protein
MCKLKTCLPAVTEKPIKRVGKLNTNRSMKNLEKFEFKELTVDENYDINGGVIALVLTTAGLCIMLYRSIVAHSDSLS